MTLIKAQLMLAMRTITDAIIIIACAHLKFKSIFSTSLILTFVCATFLLLWRYYASHRPDWGALLEKCSRRFSCLGFRMLASARVHRLVSDGHLLFTSH